MTTHRGVLYTNYNLSRSAIETAVGKLLPCVRWGDQNAVICEVIERLPKANAELRFTHIESVGADTYINDFAAIVSFRLNIVCTSDQGLANRLLTAQKAPLGIPGLPREYIPRTFDPEVSHLVTDDISLPAFIDDLVALKREHYVGAMRAIRRFVMAMHRMSDELDLAYALLVAAIESLAQEFDTFIPQWEDYAEGKRQAIDKALEGAPGDVGERVRTAILATEHAALGRRFLEFALGNIKPAFFREEAIREHSPAGRAEMRVALKNAYRLRSEYVHTLEPLPRNLASSTGFADIERIDMHPYLTFHGLARVARHVILNFIAEAPKTEKESHKYEEDYPNVTTHALAPHFWLHIARIYNVDGARNHLSGFLQEIGFCYWTGGEHKVSDLREVTKKIETLVSGVRKVHRKLPMLATYAIFGAFLPEEERKRTNAFVRHYRALLDEPTIESLFVHFIGGERTPLWPTEKSDRLLRDYHRQRFYRDGIDAGAVLSAALTLWIAEQHRQQGNEARARELITDAVDEFPSEKGLLDLEKSDPHAPLPRIEHWRIVAPKFVEANEQVRSGRA